MATGRIVFPGARASIEPHSLYLSGPDAKYNEAAVMGLAKKVSYRGQGNIMPPGAHSSQQAGVGAEVWTANHQPNHRPCHPHARSPTRQKSSSRDIPLSGSRKTYHARSPPPAGPSGPTAISCFGVKHRDAAPPSTCPATPYQTRIRH